ncbi:Uncharacterised protein [Neisseria animaloris]|nr:hypothetical protein [Neisseria animaloris]OSI06739.1 hypothetical protein BWD08_10710 [Neisseria animaloris]VEH86844.1 Uncharacterised protein [Neisseria animaloris]
MAGSKNFMILVEGETEEYFVKEIYVGNVKKINLWQSTEKQISALLRLVNVDNSIVVVILDIDVQDKIVNLVSNLKRIRAHLKSNSKLVLLIQQQNFEDELSYACSCKKQILFRCFSAVGEKEFKNKFLKERNIVRKLNQLNCNFDIFWTRGNISLPEQLSVFLNLIGTAADLEKRTLRA